MFGAWVLLSPGETGANFGIVSLVGYAVGIAAIAVGVVVVAYTSYGGLRASIYADRIQFRVLMPAMLLLRRALAECDEYDFARLQSEVGLIDEPAASGD